MTESVAPDGAGSAKWKRAALLAAGAAGTIALVNAAIFARAPKIGNRLGGAFDRYPSRHGDIAYTVRGTGRPVLLLHGFGAGNSSFEWSENIAELSEHFSVYCLDFLGWGLSDKYRHAHTAADYIEAVAGFLQDVVAEPCVVVASSGAAGIAIEAAARVPALVSGLALVCPSPGDMGTGVAAKVLQKVLRLPLLGTSLYNAIASQKSIAHFSRGHLFHDKSRVDATMIERYHAVAHQTDAQFGVYAFLSGALEVDARDAWSEIVAPAILVWGRNAQINPLETAPEWLSLKPDAELAVIDDAMLLPHAEHPAEFNALLKRWIENLPAETSVA